MFHLTLSARFRLCSLYLMKVVHASLNIYVTVIDLIGEEDSRVPQLQ